MSHVCGCVVQLVTGTIVDPTLPYDPAFRRPEKVDPKARAIPVSRPNFIELCEEVVPQFEAEYHELWATVGLSVDWDHTYTSIGPKAARTSQRGFLRLVARDLAYRSESPTLWDIDMRTSVLDLKTRILSSQERTTIQRSDFNIAGDSVQFDTNSKTGRLIGNVKMVISNKSHLTARPNTSE